MEDLFILFGFNFENFLVNLAGGWEHFSAN